MMTLLRGLHSIAAQRGDGLRPELLRVFTPSHAWTEVERVGSVAILDDTGAKAVNETERDGRSAEAVPMLLPKRD
jgi:hypothetical protein